jgi:hypothetical protein
MFLLAFRRTIDNPFALQQRRRKRKRREEGTASLSQVK